MRRRVVITGMGAITPLGHSVKALYEQQLEGRSGVDWIHQFNAGKFPTRFAAEVKNFALGAFVTQPERWVNAGPNSRFAAAAAHQALADADLLDNARIDRTRFGVYLGSGEGIQDFHHMTSLIARHYAEATRQVDSAAFTNGALKEFHAGRESEQELHTTAAHLAAHLSNIGLPDARH